MSMTTEVQGVSKPTGGVTRVTVDVTAVDFGKVNINFAAQLRARARALVAAGVVDSTTDTAGDVLMGDINRLTRVRSKKGLTDPGIGRREIRYKIDVTNS